jgi:L-malate glycosyltransferase
MKVLHVIKSLGLGGAERLLVDGAKVGPSLGLRHEVVSFLPWKDALIPALRAAGAPVTVLKASSTWGVLARADALARHLAVSRPNVVHAHLPIASVVARLACRRAGVPCVSTEHNVLERYHPATRLLTLSTWALQDQVVACSDEVAASIARHVPASPHNPLVTVVHNGVALERFVVGAEVRADVRARLGVGDDDALVGTVCVHRTQKALERWLRVAQAVWRRRPSTRFVLVGDGPERERLETLARELGLQGVVRFVGLQADPVPWLAAMDIWLSTSDFEGLPLALLEAMAAERAVVATAVGGVSEVVRDGVTGALVLRTDEPGLRDAVVAFIDDRSRAHRCGVAARVAVEERFGIRTMQRRLLRIYEDVVAARR